MQFKVPQFLDIEDKIFGPFTFRQFVYLAGGAGLCYIAYKLLGTFIGAIPMLVIAGLSLALTFYKPNGKPFIHLLEAGFKYLTQNKLYIWEKRKDDSTRTTSATSATAGGIAVRRTGPKLTGSKLRDLAWSLDVLDSKK